MKYILATIITIGLATPIAKALDLSANQTAFFAFAASMLLCNILGESK